MTDNMFTSLITAYQLACTISNKNFEGFTCADEESNARAIFENKAKYPYTLLPTLLKPTEKYNNAKQLLFEKLHSSWEVKTATKNMGRSRTINFWHGSEAAFWKDGISTIQAAIGEALTKDAIVILESTANGYNEYKELWDSGNYINCFYEWWQTDEYRFEFQNEQKKLEFEKLIRQGNKWIHERCQWLLDTIKLDLEQIFWYYNKYENYIDKELIKQEYPCFDEESFLSSGQCIFDTEQLSRRKKQLESLVPLKVGEFDIEWNYAKNDAGEDVKTTIKKWKWVDKHNGPITIYKDVKPGYPYALGGDTAGEGSDHFVGDVIDNTTKEQVAQLRHKYDEDVYAEQMYCLGKYYNEALIGIETNYSTYPVKQIANMIYPRLYMREYEDTISGKLKKSFGFETTKKTRPIVIADLVILVRDHVHLINSIETIKEMLTFIKNEKGRAEAEVGKHDDCVMSLGITHYIAAQQTEYVEKETNYNNMYDDDDDDDYKDDNYFS